MATTQTNKKAASVKPAAKSNKTTAAAKVPPKAGQTAKDAKPKAMAAAMPKLLKPSLAIDAPKAMIEKMIDSIKGRGTKMDVDIHSAACACLNHADKHGDYTLMNRLISAMPKTVRQNALIIWALHFGKFKLSEDKATMDLAPLAWDKSKSTDLEGAVAKPFWEFRNVREGGGRQWLYMDYIGGVLKTLSRVAAEMNNPEAKKAKAAMDAITAVNEALGTPSNGEPAQAVKLPEGVVKDRRASTAPAPATVQ